MAYLYVMKHHIAYPSSKLLTQVVFKLNSDDYDSKAIRKIAKYIRDLGRNYSYSRQYHNAKLMSWGVFKVKMNRAVEWHENETLAQKWVELALQA